jgi:hypothetical protein
MDGALDNPAIRSFISSNVQCAWLIVTVALETSGTWTQGLIASNLSRDCPPDTSLTTGLEIASPKAEGEKEEGEGERWTFICTIGTPIGQQSIVQIRPSTNELVSK